MTQIIKFKIVGLAPQHIRIDGGTQPRQHIDESTVAEYAESMTAGSQFPPATVFFDGSNNWLADGFHRYFAAVKAKKKLTCEVRPGTRRDAIFFSVGANATHGLRRTNADKRAAVLTLLNDAEWRENSDRWIADICGVSQPFVSEIRKCQVITVITSEDTRTGRDGKQYPITATRTGDVAASQDESSAQDSSEDKEDENDEIQPDDVPPYNDAPEADEPSESVLDNAAHGMKVVSDTLSQVENARRDAAQTETTKAPDEGSLTDNEWCQSLPIYRVLSKLGGGGVLVKRSALDYRRAEKFITACQRQLSGMQSVKNSDGSPLARVAGALLTLRHPRFWRVCGPCRGGGCARCGNAGYDIIAGLDAALIESGEVVL